MINETNSIVNWCNLNSMEANSSKFQAIMSHENDDNPSCITFDSTTIICEPVVKLLGVFIDNKLNFSFHISHIVKRGAQQLNAIRRLCHSVNLEAKLLLYKSFILSNFNYCPAVWHFCSCADTQKMEKLQKRALRCVFKDYE